MLHTAPPLPPNFKPRAELCRQDAGATPEQNSAGKIPALPPQNPAGKMPALPSDSYRAKVPTNALGRLEMVHTLPSPLPLNWLVVAMAGSVCVPFTSGW